MVSVVCSVLENVPSASGLKYKQAQPSQGSEAHEPTGCTSEPGVWSLESHSVSGSPPISMALQS